VFPSHFLFGLSAPTIMCAMDPTPAETDPNLATELCCGGGTSTPAVGRSSVRSMGPYPMSGGARERVGREIEGGGGADAGRGKLKCPSRVND
jgi:hypothetical protein